MTTRKKLLIVAGAGASMNLGIPTVSRVDELFFKWALESYPLLDNRDQSLYTFVRDEINNYYSNGNGKITNFEEVLYALLQLRNLSGDKYGTNPLCAFLTTRDFPFVKKFTIEKAVPSGFDFYNLASYLIDKLLEYFRQRCREVQSTHATEFVKFKNFMEFLNKDFEIGIITTNYDNLFKQALPSLYTGFDETVGEFLPKDIYTRNEWHFCYHIHGSVHFDQRNRQHHMHSIFWNNDLTANFTSNSSGRSGQTTMEGSSLPTSVIVAGYDKSNQINRNPFRTYYSQIEKYVLDADALLFLGYGFGDFHLNKCFEHFRELVPKRPAVVIGWSHDDEDSLQHRMDDWARNLFSTIPFSGREMSYSGYCIPADIKELKDNKEFEVSINPEYPLAVWHDGFMSAGPVRDFV